MVEVAIGIGYRRDVKIEKGRRVRMQIRLAVVDGDELESSVVEYFQGRGVMLPGLEKELEGLVAGDKKKGVVKAADAFGDPDKQIDKKLTRKDFPEDAELEEGMQFVAKGADSNQDVVIRLIKIDGDNIDAKLMHPLADKDIEFEAEILAVTDPMPPPMPGEVLLDDADVVEADDDGDDGDAPSAAAAAADAAGAAAADAADAAADDAKKD